MTAAAGPQGCLTENDGETPCFRHSVRFGVNATEKSLNKAVQKKFVNLN